jgi:activator of Hsp90 ATPase-like protein
MTELATTAPIRKTVTVSCDVDTAFRVFTDEIGTWWPTETHSVHKREVRELVFEGREGGELYEVTRSGEKAPWARVTAWEPPTRLVLAWHVNPESAAPTEIEVRFEPTGAGTAIELVHRHWERLGAEGLVAREAYGSGWDPVLERFVETVAAR